MPANLTKSAAQRERRLRLVERAYLSHKTQLEIAEAVGISQQQVSYDLKQIQDRWIAATTMDLDALRAQQLARIDELERRYLEAWELSLAPRTRTVAEQDRRAPTGDLAEGLDGLNPPLRLRRVRAQERTDQGRGNPAYLEGARWCIAERNKMLGFYKPTKIAPTDPSGEQQYTGFLEALRSWAGQLEEREDDEQDLLPERAVVIDQDGALLEDDVG